MRHLLHVAHSRDSMAIRITLHSIIKLRFFFFLENQIIIIIIVRTSFDLDSKTGVDLGPTSPNNKFVERGKKNWPESRKNVSVVNV